MSQLIPAFAFPAAAGTHLPTPEDGRLSRPWCEVAPAEIRTRNLPTANPALYHTATSAPGSYIPPNGCLDIVDDPDPGADPNDFFPLLCGPPP